MNRRPRLQKIEVIITEINVDKKMLTEFNFIYWNRISKDLYPRAEISYPSEQIANELNEGRYALHDLLLMLEHQSVHQYYEKALRGLCDGALFGLTLMTVAGLATAFFLTLLVCIDSHTWIYLDRK